MEFSKITLFFRINDDAQLTVKVTNSDPDVYPREQTLCLSRSDSLNLAQRILELRNKEAAE